MISFPVIACYAAAMNPENAGPGKSLPHRIEVNLRDVGQLFNTMDPSPFHEKDLDHDAEEFIVSWAQEIPVREPVSLIVHLAEWPKDQEPQPLVERAIHHYFDYRARMKRRELRQLMREGWQSLIIGLLFLSGCLLAGEALGRQQPGTLLSLLRESLAIGGWVAMWRPLEIYLYEWWPLHRRGRIHEKLSRMPVEVRGSPPR